MKNLYLTKELIYMQKKHLKLPQKILKSMYVKVSNEYTSDVFFDTKIQSKNPILTEFPFWKKKIKDNRRFVSCFYTMSKFVFCVSQ